MGNCKICRKGEDLKTEMNFPSTTDNPEFENAQNLFTESFEKILPLLGEYYSEPEFQQKIPESLKNYMENNPINLSNYLNNSKQTFTTPQPILFKNGNLYLGHWNSEGQMEGFGKYYLEEDKILIEGVWEKGILKYGRIFLPNNEIYEGEISNNLFHGKGKMKYSDNTIFEGEFLNGQKGNEGKIIFNDGCIYEGNLKNEIPNGKGKLIWKKDIIYIGNFINGKIEGKGEIKNEKTGSFYKGQFKNNLFHGRGFFSFNSGSNYFGDYYLGKKDSEEKYKKKNGVKYNGNFTNGKLNGTGIIEDDNYIYKCTWRNGFVVETPLIDIKNNDSAHTGNLDLNLIVENEDIDLENLSHLEKDNLLYEGQNSYRPIDNEFLS